MVEVWKPVVSHKGLYEVSTHGRVRRLWKNGKTKLLKQFYSSRSLHVYLYKNAKRSTLVPSRLVYEAFIGPIPDNASITHADGDDKNNHAKNLTCVIRRKPFVHTCECGNHCWAPIGGGFVALVSMNDKAVLGGNVWSYTNHIGRSYAVTRMKGRDIYLHRNIHPSGLVDHKNGDGHDNRRENLRPCTSSQNMMNTRLRSDNRSGYKGVSWFKTTQKYRAVIFVNGKQMTLGYFDDPAEAAKVYDEAAIREFGEFAKTNAMMGYV